MDGHDTMGKTAIDSLVALGQMRVWSLIITIFGDAVLPRGGTAPSTALAELTGAIGVKPEAFRVALSRLTRDGWIERSRTGRHSFYRLSQKGLDTFAPASARIYAAAPGEVSRWQLVARPGGDGPDGFAEVAPRLWLGPVGALVPGDALAVEGSLADPPDWARAALTDVDTVAGYAALADVLDSVLDEVARTKLDPLTAAAIRTLVIHQWRRLVLRHGDWPAGVFPEGWQGEVCRDRVHAILATLPQASNWFDTAFAKG